MKEVRDKFVLFKRNHQIAKPFAALLSPFQGKPCSSSVFPNYCGQLC